MKNTILRLTVLTGVAFVFTACPYVSSVPISEATEPVDEAIYGKWIAASDAEYDHPTFYAISELDANHYEVVENSHYDRKYNKVEYIMHSSMVGGKMFMNVQEAAGGDYHLHMIEIGVEGFTLWEMSSNIDEKFSNSADLRDFIEKYMDLSFFFTSDEKRYIKK
jgi:hypothetical protein